MMRGYNSLWIHRCSTMQPPCYPSGKQTNKKTTLRQPSIFIFFHILQGRGYCAFILFVKAELIKVDRFTLYSKSEKSRPPLPPLNPPLNPGGAPRGGPKEPLLSGRPRPPRGPMKPRPRKPPLPRLCLRGMPNVSEFIRLSSAQVDLRSLTHTKTDQDPAFWETKIPQQQQRHTGEAPKAKMMTLALNFNTSCKNVLQYLTYLKDNNQKQL